MKKLIFILLFVIVVGSVWGQEATEYKSEVLWKKYYSEMTEEEANETVRTVAKTMELRGNDNLYGIVIDDAKNEEPYMVLSKNSYDDFMLVVSGPYYAYIMYFGGFLHNPGGNFLPDYEFLEQFTDIQLKYMHEDRKRYFKQ